VSALTLHSVCTANAADRALLTAWFLLESIRSAHRRHAFVISIEDIS
jgi:hypothetical protein